MEELVVLTICFFLIAMTYASVGFGGGSSYLALMAVMHVAVDTLRPVALLCNIVVVTGSVYVFTKEGKVDLRKVLPFLITGVPLAFVGGYLRLDNETFFTILGCSLVVASVLLWIKPKARRRTAPSTPLNLAVGGGVGFLSGLVSIGGGIFLAPLLHLINWDDAKKISAAASIFILGNSVSGLTGQWIQLGAIPWGYAAPLMLAVFFGGQVGARAGARRFNALAVRRVTAVLILAAGLNILRNTLL